MSNSTQGEAPAEGRREATSGRTSGISGKEENAGLPSPRQKASPVKEAMSSCGGLKEQYDRCFNHWYRHHFLRGDLSNNCAHFFEDYRACLIEELQQKALDRLVQPNDGL